MDHFAGLDVSVKETSVCIVDDTGKLVREVKVARRRPKKERGGAVDGAHAASIWCVIAPSSATATRPCSIRSAVATVCSG